MLVQDIEETVRETHRKKSEVTRQKDHTATSVYCCLLELTCLLLTVLSPDEAVSERVTARAAGNDSAASHCVSSRVGEVEAECKE